MLIVVLGKFELKGILAIQQRLGGNQSINRRAGISISQYVVISGFSQHCRILSGIRYYDQQYPVIFVEYERQFDRYFRHTCFQVDILDTKIHPAIAYRMFKRETPIPVHFVNNI